MEINSFDLIGFDLFGVDLNSIDINTDNSVSVNDDYIPLVQNPYIKGHITTSDNTFTFKVNNTDTSVSVDANGNFKYKPTVTITRLDFVSVPELESLELFKINGVTTINVDYPTEVTFKKCDSTTISAKNYVYHIRGTATNNFQFTLKYIDGSNNVTTVTESAVIDGNGKWDVSYSGKRIRQMQGIFFDIQEITTIEFTDNLEMCDGLHNPNNSAGLFYRCKSLTDIKFAKNTILKGRLLSMFTFCVNLIKVNLEDTKMITEYLANNAGTIGCFTDCKVLSTINISKADLSNMLYINGAFTNCTSLANLYVPNNSPLALTLSLSSCPLTYDSMLRVANWLKDLTGETAQTVTFKAATYNALTAEQKATLQGIIVTQKNWILATT